MTGENASDQLHPINADLPRHNRRVIAERIGWPDGAVEACDWIEQAYPEWIPGWQHESKIRGFERPEGYYATRQGGHSGEPDLYGATAEDLAAAIEAWIPRYPWYR